MFSVFFLMRFFQRPNDQNNEKAPKGNQKQENGRPTEILVDEATNDRPNGWENRQCASNRSIDLSQGRTVKSISTDGLPKDATNTSPKRLDEATGHQPGD